MNSLYAAYQSGQTDFQAKYLDMLKAGGVKRHKELLAPFGLDASDPAFWDKGLGVISGSSMNSRRCELQSPRCGAPKPSHDRLCTHRRSRHGGGLHD